MRWCLPFPPTWRDRLGDWRNRKVADPMFRRWAARFPATRPFARRQAGRLFDLTAGFVYSQILSACVRLELFDILADGPLDRLSIATRVGLPAAGADRLLKAAVAIDLVETRHDGRYALGPLGAALVANDGVKAMIRHHDMLYRDLSDPLRLLAGGADTLLSHYWAYSRANRKQSPTPERFADYTALMAASQPFMAAEILESYPLTRHRRMLDVGGGDATFLIAAGQAAPDLQLAVFDLPPVAALAREKILAAGLSGRARAYGGNFFEDPLPRGADLIVLNRVLHDHEDDAALAILAAVRRACRAEATILITEPMADTPGARASGDAYFGFYLLAMGQGKARSPAEIGGLLAQSGFCRMKLIPTATPMIARLMTARPKAFRQTVDRAVDKAATVNYV